MLYSRQQTTAKQERSLSFARRCNYYSFTMASQDPETLCLLFRLLEGRLFHVFLHLFFRRLSTRDHSVGAYQLYFRSHNSLVSYNSVCTRGRRRGYSVAGGGEQLEEEGSCLQIDGKRMNDAHFTEAYPCAALIVPGVCHLPKRSRSSSPPSVQSKEQQVVAMTSGNVFM